MKTTKYRAGARRSNEHWIAALPGGVIGYIIFGAKNHDTKTTKYREACLVFSGEPGDPARNPAIHILPTGRSAIR